MRKLLLLAVSVSLVFTAPAMARGNYNSSSENYQKYQQDTRTPEEIEEDEDYEDAATDWEDHTVPSPQNDSQNASLAMCGKHTVFINQDDNVLTVDGLSYQLLGVDIKTVDGEPVLIDHYIFDNDLKKMATLAVFQRSKRMLFYKKGESHSAPCSPYQWN